MIFKNIHIGQMIKDKTVELAIQPSRICNFLKCSEEDIMQMYETKSLETEMLLKWSKLLEYDFFRVYSQHLILYSPPSARDNGQLKTENSKTALPQFRKNIYTKEVIDFILRELQTKAMTKNEIIDQYKIPKTTLYKWIRKYMK